MILRFNPAVRFGSRPATGVPVSGGKQGAARRFASLVAKGTLRVLAAVAAGAVAMVALGAEALSPGSPDSPLRFVNQVRNLDRTAATQGIPVEVLATVTYVDPDQLQIFIADETGGIYVASEKPLPYSLRRGDQVKLRGVTGPGEFAPMIFRTLARRSALRGAYP